MSRQTQLLLLWIFSSLIAAGLSMEIARAAFTGTEWIPVGNDSFYHARRILDAALSTRGFYQFDDMIHAPEGSWLTWPWAYDWLVAKALQVRLFISPRADPMYFLTHVAVYWIFVNSALLLGICAVLRLSSVWTLPVMLGFALSPLTQTMHGVGLIDHHFAEYSFVLLTVLTGLWWLRTPANAWKAALPGIVLGAAPAFHTGLFILQVPVLVTLFLLWARRDYPPRDAVQAFAAGLILTTFAALLPSEAFRESQFQFSVLSWFHLYIAAASTLLISTMARFRMTPMMLGGLCALGLALLIPIWSDALGGYAFLSGDSMILDHVAEARSPWAMINGEPGPMETVGYYSAFGVIAPLLMLLCAWQCATAKTPHRLLFATMALFGLALMLVQFRLHYFGSFALILGWALICNDRWPGPLKRPFIAHIAILAITFAAFMPSVSHILFKHYALSWSPTYEDVYPLFIDLNAACAENPGIAIAENDMGHPVRFHTDCSVIANSFLMTPQHEEKIRELHGYLNMSPEAFLEAMPENTHYVLTRLADYITVHTDGSESWSSTDVLQANTKRLFFELNTRVDLPQRYRVIAELPLEDRRGFGIARVIEILPGE